MYKKSLLVAFIFIASIGVCSCQLTDSIKVKITKVRTEPDGYYYELRNIETGDKYSTFCKCLERRKRERGEVVVIAKPDVIFVEPKSKAISKKDL